MSSQMTSSGISCSSNPASTLHNSQANSINFYSILKHTENKSMQMAQKNSSIFSLTVIAQVAHSKQVTNPGTDSKPPPIQYEPNQGLSTFVDWPRSDGK